MEDQHGLWIWRIVSRWVRLRRRTDTFVNRCSAAFWGVEVGPRCSFYGRTVFSRSYGSQIRIGSDCVFRSAVWSNKAGINRPCMITTLYPKAEIIVGSGVGLSGTVIAAASSIIIGDSVFFGTNVTVNDTDWHGLEPENRDEPGSCAPVVIEDNAWLGMNVTVMKGVTVGAGSVIGAGSIVTRSIPPRSVAVGQPARVIRKL